MRDNMGKKEENGGYTQPFLDHNVNPFPNDKFYTLPN